MAKLHLHGYEFFSSNPEENQSRVALRSGVGEGMIVEGRINGEGFNQYVSLCGIEKIKAGNYTYLNLNNHTGINSVEVDTHSRVIFNNHYDFGAQKFEINVDRNSEFLSAYDKGENPQGLNISSLKVGTESKVVFTQSGYQYEIKTGAVSVTILNMERFCATYNMTRDFSISGVIKDDEKAYQAFADTSGMKIDVTDKKTQSLIIKVKQIKGDVLVDSGFFDDAVFLTPQATPLQETLSGIPSEYLPGSTQPQGEVTLADAGNTSLSGLPTEFFQ